MFATVTDNLASGTLEVNKINGDADVEICFVAEALPVTLTSFEGKMEEGVSFLNWETASELNNKGFEIEHSTDGRAFSTVEFVLGQGTTQSVSNYSFLHKSPAKGDNYYRLKQIDFDGAFEYSDIVYLINKANNSPVTIYPNPASDRISYQGVAATLKIYDIYGRQLIQQTAAVENTSIDISGLEVGTYMVEISTTTNEKIFKRFIKSK